MTSNVSESSAAVIPDFGEGKVLGGASLVIVAEPFCYLLLQYLLQTCSHGGRGIVDDMIYKILRAEG
jgi:hypothetical protein